MRIGGNVNEAMGCGCQPAAAGVGEARTPGSARPPAAAQAPTSPAGWNGKSSFEAPHGAAKGGMPALDGRAAPQGAPGVDVARSLIGRGYGDINSGTPVGRDSPNMNCAQFVNAVYPDLPSGAPALHGMAKPGDASSARPGDVLTSTQPGPYGHVGILTESGSVIHSIPGRGVHESSLAEFQASSPVEGVIHR